MSTEFGIVVALRPDIDAGARQVDAALGAIETKAKETGDVVGDALAKAFDDAAKDATSALRKMAAEEKAWADAAQKAKARIAQENAALASAFTKLENAMLPAVRAEREYAEAARLAAEAVKAGVATEQQAAAVLTEKAKALEQVTVLQEKASSGADNYNEQLKKTEGWSNFKTGAMGVVDAVGKIGLAMNTVNSAIKLGELTMQGVEAAADAVFGKLKRNIKLQRGAKAWEADAAAMSQDTTSWTEELAFEQAGKLGGITSDKLLDAAIQQLEDNTTEWIAAQERESARVTAAANARRELELARRKAQQDASWALAGDNATVANEQEAEAAAKAKTAAAKAAADALAAAQAEIERTSPWNELAADIAIVAGRLGEANAAAQAWIAANVDTYEVSPWDDLAGDITTVYSKILDLADVTVDTAEKSASAWQTVGDAFAGPTQDALGGLIDGLVTLKFSFEDWARAALEAISRVIIQMALLEAIKAGFSNTSGGLGGFLWKVVGGKEGGASARMASGDPFGGAGGGAPIIAAPVERPTPGNGNGGAAPAVQLKVVVVSNERDAAREFIEGPEGERVVLAHTAKHRGKLGALR